MADQNSRNPFEFANTFDDVDKLVASLQDRNEFNSLADLQASLARVRISNHLLMLENHDLQNRIDSENRNRSEQSTAYKPLSNFDGKYVKLIQVKNITIKKFNTSGQDYRVQFLRNKFTNNLEIALLTLYFAFEEILREIFKNLPQNTLARFVLLSKYFEYPVSVRFQPIALITPEVVFAEIQKVIQSQKSFSLDEDLRIHIMTSIPPSGSGKMEDQSPSSGSRKRKHQSVSRVEFNKRSCKEICRGVHDYLCLSRALVIGQALIDYPDSKDLERMYHLQERKIAKIEEKQTNLHKLANVPIERRLYTLKDVDKFQQAFGGKYRIFVFEKTNDFHLIYSGQGNPQCGNIFLYLKDNHYHLITSVNKFLPPKVFFCTKCCIKYTSGTEYKHTDCRSICKSCLHPDCSFFLKNEVSDHEWEFCTKCNRFWEKDTCFKKHSEVPPGKKKSICEINIKCSKCELIIHRSSQKSHICHQVYCNLCKCRYVKSEEEHICFISKLSIDDEYLEDSISNDQYAENKMNSCKRPHMFFDIECEIINGFHEAILLIMQDELGSETVFYGKNCINDFCEQIFSKKYENCIFISHGGKGYDNFFPLRYCYEHSIVPKVIFNGAQILVMEITEFKITFKDNLCFLTTSLAELPKTLGLDIEVQKGFFPYNLKFPQTDSFITDLPSKDKFCVDTMRSDRKKEFDIWYEFRLKHQPKFDYFVELTTYCSQDVRILRLAAMKFRKLILELGATDPYENCLTLAHLCSVIYRKLYMPENSLSVISHSGLPFARKFSAKSIKYFEYLMKKQDIHIRHQLNGREKKILQSYVDGFVSPGENDSHFGTIYEFAGCFHHGHSCKYKPTDINELYNKTHEELYNEFIQRVRNFEQNNYKVRIVWECEYDLLYKTDQEMKDIVDSIDIQEKLTPGDALYGGRNEVFSLFKEIKSDEEMKYLDIRSLYPAVMCFEKYPTGNPTEIILNPEISYLKNFFGFGKIKILPPQNLAIPVLPFRAKKGEKIFYTLCKTCCIERQNHRCTHSEEERSFMGTYTSFEIQLALSKGYVIQKCYESWHWEETSQSSELFQDYISSFYKIKLQSEGFPSYCDSDLQKKAYCDKINKINKLDIKISEIAKNNGMRSTAKRLINSLWGKLAVKPGKLLTKYVVEPVDYFSTLLDDTIEIQDVILVSDEMVLMSYLIKDKLSSNFTNVAVASMVTSYARCWLYNRCLDKLDPSQINYVDTDSIIFLTSPSMKTLNTGEGLGDLTDEILGTFGVKDSIKVWCCSGNKSYSFILKSDVKKGCVKVKGFTLNLFANQNASDINFKSMIDIVLTHPDTVLEVIQPPLFVKDKTNSRIYTRPRMKMFQFNFDNKVITKSLQTKPYGFIGQSEDLSL